MTDSDAPREACGLFGLFGDAEAALKTYYGLFALQHRGQESAGIASVQAGEIVRHRGMGTVPTVFDAASLELLRSARAIGHTRYSTTGSSSLVNAQPLVANTRWGSYAVAHNGNLVNAPELRQRFENSGSIFQTTADSEVVLHLLAQASGSTDPVGRVVETCRELRGAFSLLVLTPDAMIGVRDPQGLRPLWLGKTPEGAYAFASETPAFDLTKVEVLREVEPGTAVVVDSDGVRTQRYAEADPAHCMFEHVYFSRPDGVVFGDPVERVRIELGRVLAREHPTEADLVIAIPDSGNAAALGYSQESGIPFGHGFIRNHYVGRSFMQPSQDARALVADLKLNVVRWAVEGKRVVVVDDSVVRGTTAQSRCRYLREAGAREVHLRVSCPPIRFPCFYGIDFQSKGELLAADTSMQGIAEHLGVDSLGYISVEGMLSTVSGPPENYCTACWSGRYPVEIPAGLGKKSCGELPAPAR
ncbi:MAG: amidophosphoribosyltransferase [Planctomycetes bacterium]|nr:amidophosphoribosyltransferase [Planctomycetota bacterium]